ncbi:polyprenyl synthetase family protein [Pendulispora albinea]|uniref:Polyprenyl synthetase family protein n=1 Tax=Pendulispora albinea TaxID=2741071 RepID=A0ABZ2LSN8_9BACT
MTSTAKFFDLATYLSAQQAHVEAALKEAVLTTRPAKICEAMQYSLLSGGKRLRPILCLASCELLGGAGMVAMPTACALEMLHTASLIHDDLPAMDNDDYRRGKLANHKVFGEGIALLAGDALLIYAVEFIVGRTEGVSAERLLRVIHIVTHSIGVGGLVGGQVADLESEGEPHIDLNTLEFIHTRKTGSLLEAAVVTGAILAGADEDSLARLSRYARNLGLAFQIIDDVLDVTATQTELGKTPRKDEKAQKATYPKLLGIPESKRQAHKLIDDAMSEIAPLGKDVRPLLAVADYVRTRSN